MKDYSLEKDLNYWILAMHTLKKSQKSLCEVPISGTRWVFEHSHGLVENTNGQGFPWKEQRIMNLFPISGQI